MMGIEKEVEASGKRSTAIAEASNRDVQRITDQHLGYKINSVKANNAAIDAEQSSFAKNQTARFASQQKGLDAAFAEHSAQVRSQSAQNAKVIAFSQNEIATAQGKINKVLGDQKFDDAARGIKQITSETEGGSKALGMWGQAFKGAFIGAVAGITFATIIGGITGIIGKGEELIVQSVEYASAFQMRENSMSIYAGSINNASAELGRLDQLSLHTTGLRLDDAEQGALRLKALGIAGQTVDNVLVGLAKQKLIFGGVNEQQVQRVLLHFDQLAGGASNTGQIVKNIIRDMPGLSRVIDNTFGSVTRFKAALNQDPDTALEKFAKGMADAKAPAGGLQNSIEKLEDTFILAGREFGKPILSPLQTSIQDLTEYLQDNSDGWNSWGQAVADAIRGASDAVRGIHAIGHSLGTDIPDNEAGYVRRGLRTGGRLVAGGLLSAATLGFSSAYEGLSIYGEAARQRDYYSTSPDEPQGLGVKGLRASASLASPGDAEAARQAEKQRQASKAARDAERIREQDYASSKEYASRDLALIKDSASIREKAFDSYHRYTTQQELDYQTGLGKLRVADINREIDLQQKNYKHRYELADTDSKERAKIALEESTTMSGLERQKAESIIETAQQQRELLVRIAEEQRQALVQAKQLEVRSIQQAAAQQTFDIQRQIDRTGTGYQDLIRATIDGNSAIVATTKTSYQIQLQDQKLTADQRVNLERQMQLDIQDLNEQTRQKVLSIQDAQYQASIQKLQTHIANQKELMTTFLGGFQSVQQLFEGNINFGGGLDEMLGLPAALGFRNSGLIQQNRSDVLGGKKSLYDAQAELQAQAQDIEMERLRAELRGQRELLDKQNGTGSDATSTDIAATKHSIRVLENQKDILGITQSIDQYQLKLNSDLATNDALTKSILSGDKDRLINAIQQVDVRKQYQAAALAYETQEVTMRDKSLVQMTRETEMLKNLTELRGRDFQAVLAIDKAQLEIQNQYRYSKVQADAKVAQFFAGQKGLTDVISDARIGLMTTAYNGLESVADRLTRKFGMFRDVVKDLISNLARLLLNKLLGGFMSGGAVNFGGGAAGTSGGGGFGLPGFNLGGAFGIGPGGTAPFNPGAALGIPGLGAAGGAASIIDPVTGLPAAAGSVVDVPLLGAGSPQAGSIGGMLGASGGIKGSIGAMLPFLGASLGGTLGGKSGLGNILGMIGGGLGGLAVGIGTGLIGTTGALSTGIAALGGTLAATGIFAAIAAPLIIGAIILGKQKQRRADEKTRNSSMVDSLSSLDKLIGDVNADRIDGSQALDQADQIRKQYLDAMSQLKDGKTRRIALADVSRLDAKISQLKQAVDGQVTRKERLDLMVPTFADGGSVSAFMAPVGYQFGYHGGRSDKMTGYFPAAGGYAKFSPTEYIFDAETTKNIGVGELDTMRATKGMSYRAMREQLPRRANGGTPLGNNLPSAPSTPISSGTSGNSPMVLELSLNVGISAEQFVQIAEATVRDANGSREQLLAILKTVKDDGNHPLVREIGKQLVTKLNS